MSAGTPRAPSAGSRCCPRVHLPGRGRPPSRRRRCDPRRAGVRGRIAGHAGCSGSGTRAINGTGALPVATGRGAANSGALRSAGRAVAAGTARCDPRDGTGRRRVPGGRRHGPLRRAGRWGGRGQRRPPGRSANDLRTGSRSGESGPAGRRRDGDRAGAARACRLPGRGGGVPALGVAARWGLPRSTVPVRRRRGEAATGDRDRPAGSQGSEASSFGRRSASRW